MHRSTSFSILPVVFITLLILLSLAALPSFVFGGSSSSSSQSLSSRPSLFILVVKAEEALLVHHHVAATTISLSSSDNRNNLRHRLLSKLAHRLLLTDEHDRSRRQHRRQQQQRILSFCVVPRGGGTQQPPQEQQQEGDNHHPITTTTEAETLKSNNTTLTSSAATAKVLGSTTDTTTTTTMSRRPIGTGMKEKVCIVGSGNWGSAIATVVGQNCARLSGVDTRVNMWVFEEEIESPGGKKQKLSDIINETHENVKYLPGIKLPHNIVAVPSLKEACQDATLLIFVLPHQFLPKLIPTIRQVVNPNNCRGVSLIKGLGELSELLAAGYWLFDCLLITYCMCP
jgi:hypothetical protein